MIIYYFLVLCIALALELAASVDAHHIILDLINTVRCYQMEQ